MGLVLIDPPVTSPVTLAEARRHCRLADDTSFDLELQGYLDAAVSHLDGPTGVLGARCLEPQVWTYVVDQFTDTIELPLRPVISVDAVRYYSSAGALQTLDPASYTVDLSSYSAWVLRNAGAAWPSTLPAINAVTIEFTAGYDLTSDGKSGVPLALRQAILLLCGHWFANRELVLSGTLVSTLPFAVDALIAPYRRILA